MRVWVRSWANFNRPGGTDRLGVFSGIEVTNGCGSDSIDCSYPVQTGVITCADGATCNIGTWTVDTGTGEPWLGAHQMTQDLIRSWKKIFFDPKHGTGITSGPGRITYPVPTGHGTHAHVTDNMNRAVADGWISIETPNQRSGDPVNHEYGHVVMANLWSGFTPNFFPTNDCPSPHFIQRVSGLGCALSEGFANFWTWYSNEFYDGTNNPANYGPVYNFGGGGSTNMKTRDNGTYDAGDRVEGNIAANMGDMFDSFKGIPFGPTNVIFADNLADGIQHVWHTTSSRRYNDFSEWWNGYWSIFGHDRCRALGILLLNTVNYSNTCPDLIVQSITTNPVSPVAGQPVNVTLTVRNQGAGAAGFFNVDWYANRATAPGLGIFGDFFCGFGGLAAGATTSCTRAFTYATAGTFNMWAQVDADDFVSETNEVNNVRGPQAISVCSVTPIAFGQTLTGTLSNTDCNAPDRPGSFADLYTFSGTAGQQVRIFMNSTFDTFLFLRNPGGTVIAFNDDCQGAGLNSCIPFDALSGGAFTLPVTGTYSIEATSFAGGATGTYTVSLFLGFNYSLANSGNIAVVQGSSGSNTITATLLVSGPSLAVSFVVSSLPAGATATFSPASCNPTCMSTLTIATTGATPTGTFPITVTGSPLARTTMFNLVVNAPFDYSLANSGDITVVQGSPGSNTITATLVSGATQAVSLAASGLPAGATPTFSPGSCSPTCMSMLTIATTGATPTGTFPITVTGSPLARTTMFDLVVNPQTFTLTVNLVGTGSGTVTGPGGISCPGVCSASFSSGTVANLTGTPDAGSFLARWDVCSGTSDCAVTMNADVTVTTTFDLTLVFFSPPTNFPVGTAPSSVAVGDFNGDGFQDLAVANSGSNDVTVLLGDGLGGFTPAPGSPFAVGTGPVSVAIGDFNLDGILDLAVANQSTNDVSVFLGDGLGGFTAAPGSPFGVGTGPVSVAIGDFNLDGILDLAVANQGTNDVSVFLGDGLGGFTPAPGSPFGVGTGPASVAVGDFNGDGFQDLAVANSGSNTVYILLGNGTGSFIAGANFPVGTNPRSVAVGDFNGDLIQDLAVANQGSNDVSVVLGP